MKKSDLTMKDRPDTVAGKIILNITQEVSISVDFHLAFALI